MNKAVQKKYAILEREVVVATSPHKSYGDEMEQQFIQQALSGDQRAFQQLVKFHLPKILGLAQKMLGNNTDAQDLSQDILLKLWNGLEKYNPDKGQFSTWVYKMTANRCLDQLRKRKLDQLDENNEKTIAPVQEVTLYEKQISKTVEGALLSLPERQKLALVLFHYQGHTMKEIAEIMETTPDAIESLLARARRKLKVNLKPVWREFIKSENE